MRTYSVADILVIISALSAAIISVINAWRTGKVVQSLQSHVSDMRGAVQSVQSTTEKTGRSFADLTVEINHRLTQLLEATHGRGFAEGMAEGKAFEVKAESERAMLTSLAETLPVQSMQSVPPIIHEQG